MYGVVFTGLIQLTAMLEFGHHLSACSFVDGLGVAHGRRRPAYILDTVAEQALRMPDPGNSSLSDDQPVHGPRLLVRRTADAVSVFITRSPRMASSRSKIICRSSFHPWHRWKQVLAVGRTAVL